MDYIIYFAITIGILVFVHEFGHFAAAKLCGMRADVFAIGFGKRLFGYNKITGFTFGELSKDFDGQGNTDYRLCLLPLGGYVKIAGMVDESMDVDFADKEPQPYEFRAKPTWMKVVVITAGVIMNLLLAWAIFWGRNYFQEKPVTKTTTIGYVIPHSPADSIGFEEGDKVLAVNGTQVNNWEELNQELFISTLGEDLSLKVERDNDIETISFPRTKIPEDAVERFLIPEGLGRPTIAEVIEDSPAEEAGIQAGDVFLSVNGADVFAGTQVTEIFQNNKEQSINIILKRENDTLNAAVTPGSDGIIGVHITNPYTGEIDYISFGFFEAIYMGWSDIVEITKLTFRMLGKVIGGDLEFGKAFGGPVKIAQFAARSADTGILSFLYFLAMLSLSLAIINILPFPVLDGGHLIIILIEGIMKREIPVKIKVAIQNTGFVILLLLMAFIIYNDILTL
ncbi:MAG: RIP metalloprotease RseP [Ignavibacteriales bacterium]|nr:MAG: RIP metalloprotease RseP [Ignavibacteriales bacterium]